MTPPRMRCVRDADASAVLEAALEVRTRGDVPLIGDDRWGEAHWARLRDALDGLAMPAGVAWATFTSGTTGAPRVVLRSDDSWVASFDAFTRLTGLGSDDTIALPVSIVSSMTVFQAMHARRLGARMVLPRSGHALAAIDEARATAVHATPLLFADALSRLEARARRGEPPRLRVAVVGGDALDASVRERAQRLGVRVVAYAGAAELSFVGVDVDGAGLRPFPGAEVRIDAHGTLWVRSPYVALGYAGDVAGPLRIDDAGWATVGDRARWLDDGRLRLIGRGDGAVLTAGATVVPADVEAALRALRGVTDAAVAGVPVPRVGHLIAAAVVLEPGTELAEVRAAARSRLPRSHVPRRWLEARSLPRTLAGKLDRRAVAAMLAPADAPQEPRS